MVKKYNKLVRDNIPQIIESTGASCSYRILEEADYLTMLDKKLDEELAEFRQSGDPEELADLLEVICGLAEARGCSWEQLLLLREQKRQKRGGFEKRILSEEVDE